MPEKPLIVYEAQAWSEFKNDQGLFECPECGRIYRGKRASCGLVRHLEEVHSLRMVKGCGLTRSGAIDATLLQVQFDGDGLPLPVTKRRTPVLIDEAMPGYGGLPVCRQRIDERGRVISLLR